MALCAPSVVLGLAGDASAVAVSQAELEPPMPTLFVTGARDEVLPEAAVRRFADGLRAAQPARTMSVASLDGGHCHFLRADRARYVAELDALFQAALGGVSVD
eukprot:5191180-Prymnesium_polylepis.1